MSPAWACRLTPAGRGAVATIHLAGPLPQLRDANGPLFQPASSAPLADLPIGKIRYGHWGGSTDSAEGVVVVPMGTATWEIHCHGGDAAVRRILDDLRQAGVLIRPEARFAAVAATAFQEECLRVLTRTSTIRTAAIVLAQSQGILETALRGLLEVEHPVELRARLDQLLSWNRFGLHLSWPWSVVITGRPNVGKSSLINALLGYERAIVFDQPGTTRDVVTAITAIDGWPIEFADTAGMRSTPDHLEAAGIALAREQLRTANCRLILLDRSQPPTAEDAALLREWPAALVVANKCDLPDAWGDRLPPETLLVSTVIKLGLVEMMQRIVTALIPDVPAAETPLPLTARQIEQLNTAYAAVMNGDMMQSRAAIVELLNPPQVERN